MCSLVSCGSDSDGRSTVSIRAKNGATARLKVEVADTPAELERGLTGRTNLGKDEGMLFVIERRGPGFWMKDTPLPLSVAFIDGCGLIVAIADMEPYSLTLHNTDRPYRFGLEVNQGWFARNAIGIGDQVKLASDLMRCPLSRSG